MAGVVVVGPGYGCLECFCALQGSISLSFFSVRAETLIEIDAAVVSARNLLFRVLRQNFFLFCEGRTLIEKQHCCG